MEFSETHTGISLQSCKMQIVEIGLTEGGYYLENIDEEYFNDFLDFNSKETKVISSLQNAFNELTLRHRMKADSVSFALPNEMFKIVEIPSDSRLLKGDMGESLKWEFRTLYPYLRAEDFIIRPLNLEEERDSDHRIIMIAIARHYIKVIQKFCSRNFLKMRYADNAHLASNNLILLENAGEKDCKYLSLYISEKNLSISVISQSGLLFFRQFNFSDASLILGLLQASLEEINSRGIAFTKAYASGDNISDTLLQSIRENCSLSLTKYNPFQHLGTGEVLPDAEFYSSRFNSFTASCGLAMRLI